MKKYLLILLTLFGCNTLKAVEMDIETEKPRQKISLNYSIDYQKQGEIFNRRWNNLENISDKKNYLANDVTHMFLALGFFPSIMNVKEEKICLVLNDVTGGRLKESVFIDIIYSDRFSKPKIELENSWEDIYKVLENEKSPKNENNFMYLNVFKKMKKRVEKRKIENHFSRISVVSNKEKEYSFYSIYNTDKEKEKTENLLRRLKEVLPIKYYAMSDIYKKAYGLR